MGFRAQAQISTMGGFFQACLLAFLRNHVDEPILPVF
jgi:hypothetical protein